MELGVLIVPTVELSPPPGRDEHSLQQVVQHGQHSAPACQVQAVPPVALLKGLFRVFRKNCVFFKIHCNPSLAYIAVRDHQSSQHNASVQSLLLAGVNQ